MKHLRPRLELVSELTTPIRVTPVHRFETWVVIWYTHGHGRIRFGSRTMGFSPGTVACIPPRTEYSEDAVRGFRSLWILAHGLTLPFSAPMVLSMGEDRRFAPAARLLLEEFARKSEGWQASCEMWLSAVIRCLRQHGHGGSGKHAAAALAGILRRHALEPGFSAAVGLARAGGSVVYQRRRFRAATGMSPTRFLAEIRLEQAANLLRLSGLSVSDIGRQCGYEDPFYFSRAFHRQFGCSPLGYRRISAGA